MPRPPILLEPQSDLSTMRAEFERCWPWLWASLCEFGPTHNKEQVWMRIASRKAFLWSEKSAAIVGEFYNYPIGLRAFNYWLQGAAPGNLKELQSLHAGIEAWAKTKGAQMARGEGRKGWLGVMAGNWQQGATVRTKWLLTPDA